MDVTSRQRDHIIEFQVKSLVRSVPGPMMVAVLRYEMPSVKDKRAQVIGRCERVMIRHDIVGVRKEKVILIVTGPFPFSLGLRLETR